MSKDNEFYHFDKGHYFYFDNERRKKTENIVIVLDVNLTKFVFAIPVKLLIKALEDHNKI